MADFSFFNFSLFLFLFVIFFDIAEAMHKYRISLLKEYFNEMMLFMLHFDFIVI